MDGWFECFSRFLSLSVWSYIWSLWKEWMNCSDVIKKDSYSFSSTFFILTIKILLWTWASTISIRKVIVSATLILMSGISHLYAMRVIDTELYFQFSVEKEMIIWLSWRHGSLFGNREWWIESKNPLQSSRPTRLRRSSRWLPRFILQWLGYWLWSRVKLSTCSCWYRGQWIVYSWM